MGTYDTNTANLDVTMSDPKYFTLGTVTSPSSDLEVDWSLTLTRSGATAGYDGYTVTYTNAGYDSANSTIESHSDINPMATST